MGREGEGKGVGEESTSEAQTSVQVLSGEAEGGGRRLSGHLGPVASLF